MTGTLECVVGPMFAGKSSELSGRYLRAVRQKRRVAVVTHRIDKRVSARHDEGFYPDATPVSNWAEIADVVRCEMDPYEWDGIRRTVRTVDLLLIDEAQFFDRPDVNALESILKGGTDVVAFGLDLDADGQPWAATAALAALADRVTKLQAVCDCGASATRTQRLYPGRDRVAVGGADQYAARCLACWSPS